MVGSMRWRGMVEFVVVGALIASACTSNPNARRFGAPVVGGVDAFAGAGMVVGPLGDSRLLGEICEASACVADLVVLPDLHPLESAVDIQVADTLGALSIERVWTGSGAGIFGEGWTSLLDVTVHDEMLTGPVGGRPLEPLVADGSVGLADGSRIQFADGRPISLCGVGMLCTNIEWTDDVVRLTAASAEERWIDLELIGGVVTNATAWDGRTVAYGYEDGRLVQAGETSYHYDDGRLAAVDDGFVPRSFTYVDGVLVEATDRDRVTWTFDAADGEVRVAGTSSPARSYVFDADKRLTTIVDDREGTLLSREYVGAALVSEERPLDAVTMTMVEPGLVAVRQTNDLAPARRATYRYDSLGRLVETVEAGASTTYGYDDSGRLRAVNHVGGETLYEYDARGLLASTTDPDGYQVEITRLSDGSISAITDGVTRTELDYDSLGRPIAQRDGSLESRAQYGARGEVVSTTDPGGATADYVYDQSGRLVDTESEFAPANASVAASAASDTADGIEVLELVSADDGTEYRYSDGSVVRYDEHGRPVETATAVGLTERRAYDSAGRLATFVGFDGVTHELTYTAGGRVASLEMDGDRYDLTWNGERLMAVRGPLGLDVSYEWDSGGSLASAVANGMEWTYHYDRDGNLARVESPLGAVEATWDDGLPTALIGPDGPAQTIEWVDGRVASLVAADDGYAFEYDEGGRIVTVSDESGDVLETYDYDERGRMVNATLDGEQIEVRYSNSGIDWIAIGDNTEFWSRSDGEVDQIRLDDRSYEIEWVAPGVLGSVSLDGETLIDVTVDSKGRITSISTGDEVRAEFGWDASGLVTATIGDETASLERNTLGLAERYESDGLSYRAEYDGLALRSIVADDVTIEYELADGNVAGSTFDDGSNTVALEWGDGSRVQSFTSSEGDGSFVYDGAVVSEIRYDDRIRTVEYGDDGRPSAEGTGGEFLDDLFLGDGLPSLGATLPATAPSIPAFLHLPDDLGVSLPKPLTGGDVVDAAVLVATPSVPSSIVAGGRDEMVDRAISTALGAAGRVQLAVDPIRSVQIAPLAESIELSEFLSSAPTFVVAASVLDRLGPDSSLLSRVIGGVGWSVDAVADGLVSLARFAVNPVTIAVANVLFVVALRAAPYCRNPAGGPVCRVGIYVLGNVVNSSSPSDFLQRAFLAPVSLLFSGLVNLDVSAWIAVAAIIAVGVRAPAFRTRVTEFGCGLKRIACLRQARFGEAAEHARDAIGAGHPRLLVVNRAGAGTRRRDALRGIATFIGKDRDEYPPAFARRAGQAVSVRLIDSSANRSAGAYLQNQTSSLRDGARFLVLTI